MRQLPSNPNEKQFWLDRANSCRSLEVKKLTLEAGLKMIPNSKKIKKLLLEIKGKLQNGDENLAKLVYTIPETVSDRAPITTISGNPKKVSEEKKRQLYKNLKDCVTFLSNFDYFLLDTNAWRHENSYFHLVIDRYISLITRTTESKIYVPKDVYEELRKQKYRRKKRSNLYMKIQNVLRRFTYMQQEGSLVIEQLNPETDKNPYADKPIISFIKNCCEENRTVLLITDDVDLNNRILSNLQQDQMKNIELATCEKFSVGTGPFKEFYKKLGGKELDKAIRKILKQM